MAEIAEWNEVRERARKPDVIDSGGYRITIMPTRIMLRGQIVPSYRVVSSLPGGANIINNSLARDGGYAGALQMGQNAMLNIVGPDSKTHRAHLTKFYTGRGTETMSPIGRAAMLNARSMDTGVGPIDMDRRIRKEEKFARDTKAYKISKAASKGHLPHYSSHYEKEAERERIVEEALRDERMRRRLPRARADGRTPASQRLPVGFRYHRAATPARAAPAVILPPVILPPVRGAFPPASTVILSPVRRAMINVSPVASARPVGSPPTLVRRSVPHLPPIARSAAAPAPAPASARASTVGTLPALSLLPTVRGLSASAPAPAPARTVTRAPSRHPAVPTLSSIPPVATVSSILPPIPTLTSMLPPIRRARGRPRKLKGGLQQGEHPHPSTIQALNDYNYIDSQGVVRAWINPRYFVEFHARMYMDEPAYDIYIYDILLNPAGDYRHHELDVPADRPVQDILHLLNQDYPAYPPTEPDSPPDSPVIGPLPHPPNPSPALSSPPPSPLSSNPASPVPAEEDFVDLTGEGRPRKLKGGAPKTKKERDAIKAAEEEKARAAREKTAATQAKEKGAKEKREARAAAVDAAIKDPAPVKTETVRRIETLIDSAAGLKPERPTPGSGRPRKGRGKAVTIPRNEFIKEHKN